METQEAPKKKYKKHKEGFKIAVAHKLNPRVKPITLVNGANLYSIYVEVRTKGKMNFFPSRYSCHVSMETFDIFLQDPLIKLILDRESDVVRKSLTFDLDSWPKLFVGHSGEKEIFTLSNWHTRYKQQTIQEGNWIELFNLAVSKEFTTFLVSQKQISKEMINNIIPDYQRGEYDLANGDSIKIVQLLYNLGIKGLDPLMELIDVQKKLHAIFSSFELDYIRNKDQKWEGFTNIFEGFTVDDLSSTMYKDYVSYVMDWGSKTGIVSEVPEIEQIISLLKKYL